MKNIQKRNNKIIKKERLNDKNGQNANPCGY